MKLHLDVETFSSEDLKSAGIYRYTRSLDFEILLIAYAFDNNPVEVIDLVSGEKIPDNVLSALTDSRVKKCAHNAAFERQAFEQAGIIIPADQWECTMIKAAYCGLPLPLDGVSKALNLQDKGKSSAGKALIKFFCEPCKPTKVNGGRLRNLPIHDPEKWEAFKSYNKQDVIAEIEVDNRLLKYELPESEKQNYILDQEINDRGIMVDLGFVEKARKIDDLYSKEIINELKKLTGLENPNSPAQLKQWLSDAMNENVETLAKEALPELLDKAESGAVKRVLELRTKSSKASIKKYTAMVNCICEDNRAHGLFQFYGANRTGRWAGRLVQLQNLKRNEMKDLDNARAAIDSCDYDLIKLMYDDIADVLSQLIRTAFIPKPGHSFAVADFSAIEARVIAWLAGEKWRMEVFNSHGKIYEASAAMMFKVPISQVTKGSDLRNKGKIAELALGYQGSLGALKKMGGESMGLSDSEMYAIVSMWRKANPSIVQLWKDVEYYAKEAIRTRSKIPSKYKGIIFDCDEKVLTIQLPSGRKLFYQNPSLVSDTIRYKGMDQTSKQWTDVDTYGGKLVENIVQAISRDVLAYSMQRLKVNSFDIAMHVHDEVITEVLNSTKDIDLKNMNEIMGFPIPWAVGLPLVADGYLTEFYKKD